MKILADNSLPGLDEAFPAPFILTRYSSHDELFSLLGQQDILLCRSTLKVNDALLQHHRPKYVATASSGTDHLDHVYLKSKQISIIDAKGCNAISVADYVTSSIAYLDLANLIKGKKAGIIGLGKVGTQVHQRLDAANFDVLHYDPLKAHLEKQFYSCELEDLYQVDILCIHAELHSNFPHPSVNLINDAFLAQLKPGCIIINAARGGIIDENALLNTSTPLIYCTDVYLNEPAIDKRIINKATLCTPHIAGHSLDAKYAAVALVSEKVHQLLGLPLPIFSTPPKNHSLNYANSKSWQELVLSLYNPAVDTLELKKASNKETAFLQLRNNHQYRRNFALYFDPIKDENIRTLLGQI